MVVNSKFTISTGRLPADPENMQDMLPKQVHSHLAVHDGQNPRNLSGAANYPGQRIRLWCKEVQNSRNFIWDSGGFGRARFGTARCDCANAPHQMLDIWLPLLKGANLRPLP